MLTEAMGGFAPDSQVMCSACLGVFPASDIRVIPWFNETVKDYLTTYRCGGCWRGSLRETKERLGASAEDPQELRKFFGFFERHSVFCLEYRRGDAPEVLARLGLAFLDKVESGAIVLNP